MTEPVYSPAPCRYDGRMPYRRCGASGVRLPALSLGFWHNFGAASPFGNSKALMHYAFDQGITCFDLANNYGPPDGSAEETFGRLMQESFRPYRDEMFIATKAGHAMWPGPYGDWGSRKSLMASLHQSLRRMKTEYVDLFYSHRFDPETPLEETLQALVDIVKQGKALYVGISKYPKEATVLAARYLRDRDVPCLVYQGRYNLLERQPEKEGILEAAAAEGMGFVSFSPLAQGLLTDRYLSGTIPAGSRMETDGFLKKSRLTPDLLDRLRRLDRLAGARGQTLAEMALAWNLMHPQVVSVIIGASSVEQLKKNLKATASAGFSAEELARIEQEVA